MSPTKWIFVACVAIGAYWLWPVYIIVAFIVLASMMPGSGKVSRPRSSKSRHKPSRSQPRRQTVYRAPRYPRPRPRPKGRLLKSGIRQHYRNGRWTPKAIKHDLPD